MNRKHGLLAFLCTVIVIGATAVQVPFLSGIACVSAAAEGKLNAGRSAFLAKIFTPPTAPKIPSDSAGKSVVTLFQIQREHRADRKLLELAQTHHIPFSVLKAYLAIWSKGEKDEQGYFWGSLPGKNQNTSTVGQHDNGLHSSTIMANNLGKFAQLAGTYQGAIIASETGTMRAARTAKFSHKSKASFLRSMRLSLLASNNDLAENKLCSVLGLASALDAKWPVPDHDIQMRQGSGVRLASSPGEEVFAPMAGTVTYAGENDGGICVEITICCDMRSTICDLKYHSVKPGQVVRPGTMVGISGTIQPVYRIFLGSFAVDASQFLPPAKVDQQQIPDHKDSTESGKTDLLGPRLNPEGQGGKTP